jgi:hypothetical protein
MRNYLWFSAFSLLCGACLGGWIYHSRTTSEYRIGDLALSTARLDLGIMDRDSVRTANFTLSNRGSKDLHIVDFYADCGCTVPTIDNRTIRPGESKVVTVKYNTTGAWRRVKKNIYIKTDDEKGDAAVVSVEGYVRVGVRSETNVVDFGNLLWGTKPAEMPLTLFGDADLKLLPPKLDPPIKGVSISGGNWQAGSSSELQACHLAVKVDPRVLDPGNYVDSAVLKVNEFALPVTLTYQIQDVVTCVPATLKFSLTNGREHETGYLSLVANGVTIRVESLESQYHFVEASEKNQDSSRIELEIRKSATFPHTPDFDVLKIKYAIQGSQNVHAVNVPISFVN